MNAEFFRGWLHISKGVAKYMVTDRVITIGTRVIDLLVVSLVIKFPGLEHLPWILCLDFVLGGMYSVLVVYVNDRASDYGLDLTSLDALKQSLSAEHQKKGFVTKILAGVLESRRAIFWIGSWFYLDPDYVTILLRDRTRSVWKDILRVTVPSTLLASCVWVPLYWIAVHTALLGIDFSRWLIS